MAANSITAQEKQKVWLLWQKQSSDSKYSMHEVNVCLPVP